MTFEEQFPSLKDSVRYNGAVLIEHIEKFCLDKQKVAQILNKFATDNLNNMDKYCLIEEIEEELGL